MRVNCFSVTVGFTAIYAIYLVYIYFIQHQPHANLLSAIKSKSTHHFQHTLTTSLTSLPHHSLHSLHFGSGRTVAAAIAMHGTIDMLHYWAALGGDVSTASTTDGRTPLHVAATFNTDTFVRQLLSLLPPSHVHSRADNSYTPLLYSVLFSQHNNTRTLLQYGADPNDRLTIGAHYSACQLAAIYSDGRMMDELVEAGGIIAAEDAYYDDWLRGLERVQLKREQQEAESDVEWDGAESGEKHTQHWAVHMEQTAHSENVYSVLNS